MEAILLVPLIKSIKRFSSLSCDILVSLKSSGLSDLAA